MSDTDRVGLRYCEESAFGVTPTGELLNKTTVSAAAADDSYNDSTEDLSVFKAGQTILVSGFTDGANNGYKTVVSATANKIVVEEALADEAAGDSVSIKTAFKKIRFTSESLKQETDMVESQEIRDDRQVSSVQRSSYRANGDIGLEFSYETWEEFIRAAIQGASWSAEIEDTDTIYSMVASDNSINRSAGSFVSDGYSVGEWIRTSGFTETENNSYFKIKSVAATKMELERGTVVDESAGDSVTVEQGSSVTNGTTLRSFTVEKEYFDLTGDKVARYAGMHVDTFDLEIAAAALMTGSVSFLGKNVQNAASSAGTGTPKEAPTSDVQAGIDDVVKVVENDVEIDVTSIGLSIANNLRGREIIGNLGLLSVGAGKIAVTGTLQRYYEDANQLDRFLSDIETGYAIVLEDDDGNGYVFEIPRLKYTDGQRVAGGQNADVMADMSWSAYRHETEGITIRVARFPA